MDSLNKRVVIFATLVALVMLGSVLVAQPPCDRACASACLVRYQAALKACDGSPACLVAAREEFRAVLASTVAQPVSAQVSTILDPVGDTLFNAPAFQDIVSGQITKTESGNFELLMGMAGPVPADPPLPPPGVSEIWWMWTFDLDPTAFPQGTPFPPGVKRRPELVVYVSWDGTEFAGTAIDRRPLLIGGEAIITPVPFSTNGIVVYAVLDASLIGDVPPSFSWGPFTVDWSGPVGSAGHNFVDGAETVFDPLSSAPSF